MGEICVLIVTPHEKSHVVVHRLHSECLLVVGEVAASRLYITCGGPVTRASEKQSL